MTKADLVKDIADRTGLDPESVTAIVEALMKSIKGSLGRGDNVYLRGFGTFQVKLRGQKIARSFGKGEPLYVPPQWAPKFKPVKSFVQRVSKSVPTE